MSTMACFHIDGVTCDRCVRDFFSIPTHPDAFVVTQPPVPLEKWILDLVDARLAAMAARIDERDKEIARLRREMDALILGLKYGNIPNATIAEEMTVAGDKPCE